MYICREVWYVHVHLQHPWTLRAHAHQLLLCLPPFRRLPSVASMVPHAAGQGPGKVPVSSPGRVASYPEIDIVALSNAMPCHAMPPALPLTRIPGDST